MLKFTGGKIGGVSWLICLLGISACLLLGLMAFRNGSIGAGLVIAILGSALSWASCLTACGFGQLVEGGDVMAGHLQGREPFLREDERK